MTTIIQRRIIRRAAGCRPGDRSPVEVVPGDAAPRCLGEGHCYRTKGGAVIAHPSAYSKSGWSNMTYCASTLRVEVGAEWIDRYAPADRAAQAWRAMLAAEEEVTP